MANPLADKNYAETLHAGQNSISQDTLPRSVQQARQQASDIDLKTWPGWVDLLSEPSHFTTLLHEFGVTGIRVHEVLTLEAEHLLTLPRPVYALIFLFRWKQIDREDLETESPEGIWFAQQVAENACASNALLNIVNNIPGLELGSALQAFKDRTQALSSIEKGQEVKEFDHVRAVHNSFATQAEVRDVDMLLKQTIAAAQKAEAARARKAAAPIRIKSTNKSKAAGVEPTRASGRLRSKAASPAPSNTSAASNTKRKAGDEAYIPSGKRTKNTTTTRDINNLHDDGWGRLSSTKRAASRKPPARHASQSDADAAFHFCAYMPIGDQLWRLDGLQSSPELLGNIDLTQPEDWLIKAANTLTNFMTSYAEETFDFSLMAVVKEPLLISRSLLCENIKSVQAVEKKLASVVEDWQEAEAEDEKPKDLVDGVDVNYSISQRDLNEAESSKSLNKKLAEVDDLAMLLDMRQTIAKRQPDLKRTVREDLERARTDEQQSYYYRHGYDEFFDSWLDELAEVDALDMLMAEADAE